MGGPESDTEHSHGHHRHHLHRLQKPVHHCCKWGDYEVNDIDLTAQTELHFPGKRWSDLSPHDQVEVIRRSLCKKSHLIDPHCNYMKCWDVLILIGVLFVGIVTPYEVIFVGPLQPQSWLFILDRIIDLVFVKDIVLQFFLKVEVPKKGKAGPYLVKDPWVIRRKYLTSWFPLDVMGVIQFDLILLTNPGSRATFQGIKFLRMVRLLRVMKVVRMLRGTRAISRLQNYITLSFAMQKLIKFCLGTILVAHWMACFWGLVGFSLGRELCVNGVRVVDFPEANLPAEDVSWVTRLYLGGKFSPDDPCNPWHVYTAALYWSVMTVTTVGYGDIVPVRSEEYVACVVCMLVGGVLWANIIGGVCACLSRGDPVEDRYEQNADFLNGMMAESGIPRNEQFLYREFLREAKVYDAHAHFRSLADNFSPHLKGKLLLQIHRAWTTHIPYLWRLDKSQASMRCLMALVEALEQQFFARKESLHISSDRLCIIELGTVARGGKILTPGGVFNIDFIVGKPSLRRKADAIAWTYSMIMNIGRERFYQVIAHSPEVLRDVSKAAVQFAMGRVLYLCSAEYKYLRKRGESKGMTFAGVFDCVVLKAASGLMHVKPSKMSLMGKSDDGMSDVDSIPYSEMSREADPMAHRRAAVDAAPTIPLLEPAANRQAEAMAGATCAVVGTQGMDGSCEPTTELIPMTPDEYRRFDFAESALRNALAEIAFLRSKAIIDYGRASTQRDEGSRFGPAEDTWGDRSPSMSVGLLEDTHGSWSCQRSRV